jgi:hypothetical protein
MPPSKKQNDLFAPPSKDEMLFAPPSKEEMGVLAPPTPEEVGQPATPARQPEYGQALLHGTQQHIAKKSANILSNDIVPDKIRIPMQAISALYDKLKPRADYVPETGGEQALSFLTTLPDPGMVGAGMLGKAMAAPLTTGLLTKGERMAHIAASGHSIPGLSGAMLRNKLATSAIQGAGEFGVIGATHSLADSAESGRLLSDPTGSAKDAALHGAIGAGTGAILNPALTAVGSGIARAWTGKSLAERTAAKAERFRSIYEPETMAPNEVANLSKDAAKAATPEEFEASVRASRDRLMNAPKRVEKLEATIESGMKELETLEQKLKGAMTPDELRSLKERIRKTEGAIEGQQANLEAQLKAQRLRTLESYKETVNPERPTRFDRTVESAAKDYALTEAQMAAVANKEANIARFTERLKQIKAEKEVAEADLAFFKRNGGTDEARKKVLTAREELGHLLREETHVMEKMRETESAFSARTEQEAARLSNRANTVQSKADQALAKKSDAQSQTLAALAERSTLQREKLARATHNKITLLESQRDALKRQRDAGVAPPTGQRKAALEQKLAENAQKLVEAQEEFYSYTSDPSYKRLIENQKQLADLKVEVDGKKVSAFEVTMSNRGVVRSSDDILYYTSRRDIPGRSAGDFGWKDALRMAETVDGGQRGRTTRQVIEPMLQANAAKERHRLAILQEHRKLAADAGAGPVSWRDKLTPQGRAKMAQNQRLFRMMEGRLPFETPSPAEKKYMDFVRAQYDSLLDGINAQRVATNQKPIPKRGKNYVTHLQDLSNSILDLGTSEIVGDTAPRKAGSKVRQFFEKARHGDEAVEDIVGAFEAYLDPALRGIHYTRPGINAKAMVELMPNNTRQFFERWLDNTAFGGMEGKDAFLTRNGMGWLVNISSNAGQMFAGGAVGGNLRIVFQQPSQTLVGAAATNMPSAIKAMGSMHIPIDDAIMELSPFLTQRLTRKAFDRLRFNGSTLQTPQKFIQAVTDSADYWSAKHTWLSAFHEGKAQGLTEKAAIRYADKIGEMVHGVYDDMYRPAILRGRMAKGMLPFQTFAFNMWQHVTHDQRLLAQLKDRGALTQFMRTMGAMVAANNIYEAMGLPTPFELGNPVGYVNDGMGPKLAPSKIALPGFVPFSGKGRYDSAAPANALLQQALTIAFSERDEDKEKAVGWLQKNAPSFLPNGVQIARTYKGIQDARRGYSVAPNGEMLPLQGRDKVLATLLGPNNTTVMRDFYKQRDNRLKGPKYGPDGEEKSSGAAYLDLKRGNFGRAY